MIRRTSTRAVINLFDTTAKLDGQYVANDMLAICDLGRLNEDSISTIKFATLEDEGFLLDGSYQYMDENTDYFDLGYWSNSMSNAEGLFDDENPKLTREFTENHSSAGITLYFDENYPLPVQISISIYDESGNSINSGLFQPDSYNYFCDLKAENYRKIVIDFIKTMPYSYARLNGIEYGKCLEYSSRSDKNISKASLLEELDITSAIVSVNTSSITVIDHDETFNIDNPQGYYSLLQERQKIQIFETLNDVEYEMASHYLKSWETTSGVISTFKNQDILGVMDGSIFKGSLYNDVPALDIIDEIMISFGWSDYYVDDDIATMKLTGIITPCSHRAALQQVMFAVCGVIDTSRISGINMYKTSHSTSSVVLANRKFMSPAHKITQKDLITDIEITAHKYSKSADKQEVYSAELNAGRYEIILDNPCSEYELINCTLIESGYFYLIVDVNSVAEVKVNAYVHEDNTTIYRRVMQDLPAGSYRGTKKITDATLISSSNAQMVAEHLYQYYQYRLSHEMKIICEDEKVGNFSAVKRRDNLVSVLFESMDIDLTGGFLAKCKGVGYALRIGEYNYTGELYAGDEYGVI